MIRTLLAAAGLFGLALGSAGCGAHGGGTTGGGAAATGLFSGEQVYRGLYFVKGPVAALFPELEESEPAALHGHARLQRRIMRAIAKQDPSFFARFGLTMQSGDPVKIDGALREATTLSETVQSKLPRARVHADGCGACGAACGASCGASCGAAACGGTTSCGGTASCGATSCGAGSCGASAAACGGTGTDGTGDGVLSSPTDTSWASGHWYPSDPIEWSGAPAVQPANLVRTNDTKGGGASGIQPDLTLARQMLVQHIAERLHWQGA